MRGRFFHYGVKEKKGLYNERNFATVERARHDFT